MRCPMAKWTKVSKHDFSGWAFLVNQSPALAIGALLIGLGAIVLWCVPLTRDDQRTLPLLLGGGLALLGVIALLYPVGCWFTRSRYAEVFEEGLKWSRGRHMNKTPWDEVRQVYRSEVLVVGNEGDPFSR